MKRIFLIFVLLSLLFSCVSIAESYTVNIDVVKSMLESSLENGFGIRKNPVSLLESAFDNGYDYFDVQNKDSSNSLIVSISVYGFSSALDSLVNENTEESKSVLIQAKETIISQCKAFHDLFSQVGRSDVRVFLKIIDDNPLQEYGIKDMNIAVLTMDENCEIRFIYSKIEQWKDTE